MRRHAAGEGRPARQNPRRAAPPDCVGNELPSRLTEDDFVSGGQLLKLTRGIHYFAGDDCLSFAELARDDFAAVDSYPYAGPQAALARDHIVKRPERFRSDAARTARKASSSCATEPRTLRRGLRR